jgi:molecular chaperone GrpE
MTANEDERMVDKRAAARMRDDEAGDGSNPEVPQGAAGDLAAELAAEREKAEGHYRSWQRTAADFANYKRRIEQERSESARLAGAALVINLLPIFDDLDRAVSNVDAQLAGLSWVQGIIAIERKFATLMEAMSVTEVPAEGEKFDPARHEAVGKAPGDDGMVLHVVQKGYQLGDKVLRPSMVIVGEGSP